jgi:hypothetical protein
MLMLPPTVTLAPRTGTFTTTNPIRSFIVINV